MESSAPEDDFGVRLEWPEDPLAQSGMPPSTPDPPPSEDPWAEETVDQGPGPQTGPPPPSSIGLDVVELAAGETDVGAATRALAGIAARLDTVVASTTTFRDLVSQRLGAVTQQLNSLVAGMSQRLDSESAALSALRSDVSALRLMMEDHAKDLEGVVQRVSAIQDGLEERFERLSSELEAVRRRTSIRGRSQPVSLDDDQLDTLAELIRGRIREDAEAQPRPARGSGRRT